jgi:hypothetical protein
MLLLLLLLLLLLRKPRHPSDVAFIQQKLALREKKVI